MTKKLLMGNEAMGLGAIRAGVAVVTGYPGTPSTEVLESVVKNNPGDIYIQWSVNEKTALEVAAGASYCGKRTLVTMKQVGLNVASDPLMSLAYVGIKGGMVILVADDPGPISSQTEQDTRTFAAYSKLPVFDPSSPEEAYLMMADAYELSEKYKTPVLFRPTTRICHACASIELLDPINIPDAEGFVKSPNWVIFPRLSYNAHKRIEARNTELSATLSGSMYNSIKNGSGTHGIASGGVSFMYTAEAMCGSALDMPVLKVGIPFPFPEKLALDFLNNIDEVTVFEELDPVIEKNLIEICGKYHLNKKIHGKLDGTVPNAGELGTEIIAKIISGNKAINAPELPKLPVRPPVLCAGCPHRASFYAVKLALADKKAVFCGDIGCYTLGNAMPLNMVDTCLCMGAGITVAQGIKHAQPDTVCVSFTGDSTFFHTGIPNLVNAVYNDTDMVAVILDNSTTAMTGHQPNPSTGKNAMGEIASKIDIAGVLHGIGITDVQTVDPLKLDAAIDAVKKAAANKGVSAIIFKSPCIAVIKPDAPKKVDADICVGCKNCITELGCPALVTDDGTVKIDASLCSGCGLCTNACPVGAIS